MAVLYDEIVRESTKEVRARVNVNKWRNWALVFMFGGFFIMYCGVFNRTLLPYLLVVGGIGVVIGILMYFRFGPVNSSIPTMECPRCGERIRLTGPVDACSHCHQRLRRTEAGTYEPDTLDSGSPNVD